jgi:hypothetical protein
MAASSHQKVSLLLLNGFCELNVQKSFDKFMTIEQLHDSYLGFVVAEHMFDSPPIEFRSKPRFAKQIHSLATKLKWQYSRHNEAGYYVEVVGRRQHAAANVSMPEMIVAFNVRKDLWADIEYISKVKGNGLVAQTDIPAKKIVARYTGGCIPVAEAQRRDALYAQEDPPRKPTMVFLTNANKGMAIDGYQDIFGREIALNFGRIANHSIRQPNCRLKTIGEGANTKAYLVSLRWILKGSEITWDYCDDQPNLPAWYHRS